MRSARTVSSVIRMTFGLLGGLSAGLSAAAVNEGNRAKKQRFRIKMRRVGINEKGVCSVANSPFENQSWSQRSEHELHANLSSARPALRKERVATRDIRCLRIVREAGVREVVEPALRNGRAARQRIEVRMIQQVEDF